MEIIKIMESLLSDGEKERLKKIFAPKVICTPPEDARRGMCVMPDGELRYYGIDEFINHKVGGKYMYTYSRNCGLDWYHEELPEGSAAVINYGKMFEGKPIMGASVCAPWSGRYIAFVAIHSGDNMGTYAMLSDIGPGDENPRMLKVSDEVFIDMLMPTVLPDRKRWIVPASICRGEQKYTPTLFISDDDGENWKMISLKSTPKHTPIWPHLGVRWQNNGSEPTLALLPDGRLMVLARTSLDYFYEYYSDDYGDTWTDGAPSRFHGTTTSPNTLRLHDGRVILFWNNTRPLSEVNHDMQWPPVNGNVKNGNSEDFFTNRDANHVAITEDGKNWIGFRELYLNDRRGASDFRVGGSGDNSVHQFQALELPFGKILVAFGQHEFSRRMVIFDVNWLYEKHNEENFSKGLSHLTTHLFVKSVPGSHAATIPGHCSMNRTSGALLMPDPDGNFKEALQICRVNDKRLLSELQGAVWNFPKIYRGEIKIEMYLVGSGIKVRLCDHWMNAGDQDVGIWALFDFVIDSRIIPLGEWSEIIIKFDTEAGKADVYVGTRFVTSVLMRGNAPDGLSYLHLQTSADQEDFDGVYIRLLSACGE